MSVKITLNVEADTPAELRAVIAEMAGASYSPGDDVVDEAGASAEPPKNRGGRPRKPATTDAAPATNASGDLASTPESGTAAGSASGPTATTAASPSDTTATAGGVTKEQVAAAMQTAMAASSPKAVQDALVAKSLGARLSEIKPEDYGTALEVLNGLTIAS